jgi:hypothetical protein
MLKNIINVKNIYYIYNIYMVKAGFLKTIRKNIYFNKSLLLLLLLILIIILFFIFNKSIENLEGIQRGPQSMEAFIWVIGTETPTKDANLIYKVWPDFKEANRDDDSLIFERHQHLGLIDYIKESYPEYEFTTQDINWLRSPEIFPVITFNLRDDRTGAPMKNDMIFIFLADKATSDVINKRFIDYKNKYYSQLYTNGGANTRRSSTQPDTPPKEDQIKPAS